MKKIIVLIAVFIAVFLCGCPLAKANTFNLGTYQWQRYGPYTPAPMPNPKPVEYPKGP